MAESFSVKAILSANDSNFSSVMKSASSAAGNLKSTITSGLGFGILTGIGQQAFSAITSGITGMVGELSSSGAAWKTFTANMEMNGKTEKEIKSIKNELQSFAEATIYSSSDMASTFAQLEAVGTKNTTKLVKGFGGLASAAENPTQAMKTLSQQATQMASKPTVAWMDFKLMLEQTPAGIAAVAKEMGMTTSELVRNVQDGKVATEDFFDAISNVGTNDAFTKLATEYKTVGQAMDGLQETMANKLQPAFDTLSGIGIKAISEIVDKMGEIDGNAVAGRIMDMVNIVAPYWEVFSGAVKDAASACGDAFGAIGSALGDVLSKQSTIDTFKSAVEGIAGAVEFVAGIIEENADTIVAAIPYVAGLALAFKGFQIVKAVVPFVGAFSGAISQLAAKGIGSIASKLFGIAGAQAATGAASASSATQVLAAAGAVLALGAAVLMVSAGFYLLVTAAINLASAGPLAIAILIGMVAAIAGLAIGAAALGPALTAGAVGFIAFGAAIALVGVGALLAATALTLVAGVLPTIVQYGLQGAACIAVLGAGMLVFGAGAAIAGAGCIVLGAGLAIVSVGLALVGAAVLITAAGVLALAAGMLLLGAGMTLTAMALMMAGAALPMVASGAMAGTAAFAALLVVSAGLSAVLLVMSVSLITLGASVLVASVGIAAFALAMTTGAVGTLAMSVALKAVNSSMKSIASNAKSAQKSLSSMRSSVSVVNSGLDALGSKAKSAINSLINNFTNAEGKAKSSGKAIGDNFNRGVSSGMNNAVSTAVSLSASVVASMRSASSGAYSSGYYIGIGLANGMRAALGAVQRVAAQLASAANAAIVAKAKIGSPSKVTTKLGAFYGQGWVNGIISKVKDSIKAVRELVSIPDISAMQQPEFTHAGSNGLSELNDEYNYGTNATYTIIVPVELEGKEIARVSAPFTKEELEKLERRNSRKQGYR